MDSLWVWLGISRVPDSVVGVWLAPHSSTLAWKIPWTRSLEGCSPWGREESESDTTERLHFHFSVSCIGEGNGSPLQCSCRRIPGTGDLVGCCLWSRTESDTTEATYLLVALLHMGSYCPNWDQTRVFCTARRTLNHQTTRFFLLFVCFLLCGFFPFWFIEWGTGPSLFLLFTKWALSFLKPFIE